MMAGRFSSLTLVSMINDSATTLVTYLQRLVLWSSDYITCMRGAHVFTEGDVRV